MKKQTGLRIVLTLIFLLGAFALTAQAEMMKGSRTGSLSGSEGHDAAGMVLVENNLLTLKNIDVERVPDGQVYLGKNGDHRQGVHLGKLNQFSGTVTFKIPEGIDTPAYDSVIIYSERYSTEIGRTPLK